MNRPCVSRLHEQNARLAFLQRQVQIGPTADPLVANEIPHRPRVTRVHGKRSLLRRMNGETQGTGHLGKTFSPLDVVGLHLGHLAGLHAQKQKETGPVGIARCFWICTTPVFLRKIRSKSEPLTQAGLNIRQLFRGEHSKATDQE